MTEGTEKNNRFWIAVIGGGAALVLGGLLLTCCAGVLVYSFWGGSGSKLVGQWDGNTAFVGMQFKVSVEFKSNGRFTAIDGLGDTWTGTWKVKLVEGNDYHLNLVYDSEPDRVKGWTVTFKDDDTIVLSGFVALTPTLSRKK